MIDVEAQKVLSIIVSNMLIIYNYSGCQVKKISISKVIYYTSIFLVNVIHDKIAKGFCSSFYQA